jgi:hypothetical protein
MSSNPHGHGSLRELGIPDLPAAGAKARWGAAPGDGEEDGDLARVARRLVHEFGASVPPEVVRHRVADIAARFDQASVPNYVPVLVERLARAWLRDAVRESEHRPALRSVPTDVGP